MSTSSQSGREFSITSFIVALFLCAGTGFFYFLIVLPVPPSQGLGKFIGLVEIFVLLVLLNLCLIPLSLTFGILGLNRARDVHDLRQRSSRKYATLGITLALLQLAAFIIPVMVYWEKVFIEH